MYIICISYVYHMNIRETLLSFRWPRTGTRAPGSWIHSLLRHPLMTISTERPRRIHISTIDTGMTCTFVVNYVCMYMYMYIYIYTIYIHTHTSRRIFHRPTIMIKSLCRHSTVWFFPCRMVSYFFQKNMSRQPLQGFVS